MREGKSGELEQSETKKSTLLQRSALIPNSAVFVDDSAWCGDSRFQLILRGNSCTCVFCCWLQHKAHNTVGRLYVMCAMHKRAIEKAVNKQVSVKSLLLKGRLRLAFCNLHRDNR